MEVSEVTYREINKGTLKGYADVTFDGEFIVRGVKLVNGFNGLFVGFPSEKGSDQKYRERCHPLNSEFREKVLQAVLKEAKVQDTNKNDENWFE